MRMNSSDGIKTNKGRRVKEFNFYTLKNGSKISCHGRPKKVDIQTLKEKFGVNFILTIQHEKEQPQVIKQYIDEVAPDIMWKNLPLTGANMALFMKPQTQKMVISCLLELLEEMKKKELILFLHCAAGVHRTGTVLYSILRMCGEDQNTALDAMKSIRLETYRNCGTDRIHYAEEFLVKPLYKILKEKEENMIKENKKEEELIIPKDK